MSVLVGLVSLAMLALSALAIVALLAGLAMTASVVVTWRRTDPIRRLDRQVMALGLVLFASLAMQIVNGVARLMGAPA